MKRDLSDQTADDYLAPVRAWAHGKHGAVTQIAEKLSERLATDEKDSPVVHRQTVGRWLHKDPENRNQPSLGLGLLLVEVYEELATEGESDGE